MYSALGCAHIRPLYQSLRKSSCCACEISQCQSLIRNLGVPFCGPSLSPPILHPSALQVYAALGFDHKSTLRTRNDPSRELLVLVMDRGDRDLHDCLQREHFCGTGWCATAAFPPFPPCGCCRE